jgi:hypothetical protein
LLFLDNLWRKRLPRLGSIEDLFTFTRNAG